MKIIKGFKKTLEIKKKIEEVNMWIEKNGWKKILPDDEVWQYEPISNYKNELGITGRKANECLEKMGFIIREEKNKEKEKTKKRIILTEKGKEFGKQMIKLIAIPKDERFILKAEQYVIWSPKIVKEIKNYLAKGEEKNGN